MLAMWLIAPAEQAAIYPWQVLVPFFNRCDINSGVHPPTSNDTHQQPQSSATNQHITKLGNGLNRSLEDSLNPRQGSGAGNGEINANYLLNGGSDDQGLSKRGDAKGSVACEQTIGSGGAGGDALIECNTEVYDDGAVSDCLSTDPGNCSQSAESEATTPIDMSTKPSSESTVDREKATVPPSNPPVMANTRRTMVGFGATPVGLDPDSSSSSTLGSMKRRSFSTSCIGNRKKPSKSSADGGGQQQLTGSEEKIPRPMNAFMVFSKRQRQRVQEENRGLDNREISRKLGEMWYSLPEDEKRSYQNLAQEIKEKFKEKYPDLRYSSSKKEKQRKSKSGNKVVDEELANEQSTNGSRKSNVQSGSTRQQDQCNSSTAVERSQSVLSTDGDDVDGLPNVDFDDDDVIVDDVATTSSTPKFNQPRDSLADIKAKEFQRMRSSSYGGGPLSSLQQMNAAAASYAAAANPIGVSSFLGLHQMGLQNPFLGQVPSSANDIYMRALLQSVAAASLPKSTADLLAAGAANAPYFPAQLPGATSSVLSASGLLGSSTLGEPSAKRSNTSLNSGSDAALNMGIGLPQYKPLADHTASMLQKDDQLSMPRSSRTYSVDSSLINRSANSILPQNPTISKSNKAVNMADRAGFERDSNPRCVSMSVSDGYKKSEGRVSNYTYPEHMVNTPCPTGLLTFAKPFKDLRSVYDDKKMGASPRSARSPGTDSEPCEISIKQASVSSHSKQPQQINSPRTSSSSSISNRGGGFISSSNGGDISNGTSVAGGRIVKAPLANIPCDSEATAPAPPVNTPGRSSGHKVHKSATRQNPEDKLSKDKEVEGSSSRKSEQPWSSVNGSSNGSLDGAKETNSNTSQGDPSKEEEQITHVSFRNQNANVEKMLEEVDFTAKFSKLPGRSSRGMLGGGDSSLLSLNRQLADNPNVTVDSLYPRKRRASYQTAVVNDGSNAGDESNQRKNSSSSSSNVSGANNTGVVGGGGVGSGYSSVAQSLLSASAQNSPLVDSEGSPGSADERNFGNNGCGGGKGGTGMGTVPPSTAGQSANKQLTRKRAIAFELISMELYPNDAVINEWFKRNHQLFVTRDKFLKVLREVRQQYMKQARAAAINNNGTSSSNANSGPSAKTASASGTQSLNGAQTSFNKESTNDAENLDQNRNRSNANLAESEN